MAIEDDATTEVKIEVRPFEDERKRDELIFRVTVTADGKEVYVGQPTSCLQCDETKLLASVRTRLAEAVGHLPEQPEPAVAEDPVPDEDLAPRRRTPTRLPRASQKRPNRLPRTDRNQRCPPRPCAA